MTYNIAFCRPISFHGVYLFAINSHYSALYVRLCLLLSILITGIQHCESCRKRGVYRLIAKVTVKYGGFQLWKRGFNFVGGFQIVLYRLLLWALAWRSTSHSMRNAISNTKLFNIIIMPDLISSIMICSL